MYVPSVIHDASVPDMIERDEPQKSMVRWAREAQGSFESVPTGTE
jgi:hypothetical protein